jgi:multidrug resistance protein
MFPHAGPAAADGGCRPLPLVVAAGVVDDGAFSESMLRPSPKAAVLGVVGLAFFTDNAAYSMLPPLLPEYARLLGLRQNHLGLLFSSFAMAVLLTAFPLGAWADRRGRRGPFLAGLAGFGAATLLFAFAGSFPVLLLARVLQGVAAAATWVTGQAMIADHFPGNQRGRAMSAGLACANLGLFLGPGFAGWMARLWTIRAAFLAVAALAVVNALARLALLPADPPGRAAPGGLWALLRDAGIRRVAGVMAMAAGLEALLEAILPLHLARALGMGSAAIGMAFTTAALASICTSPLAGLWTDRRGPAPPMRLGMALATLLVAGAAQVPGRAAVYAYMLVFGSAASLLMSPCGPAMAARVERKGAGDFGSVYSLLNVAFSLGMIIGPLLGSALTERFGLGWAGGALSLGFGLYLVVLCTRR